jgi:hypothetical protein
MTSQKKKGVVSKMNLTKKEAEYCLHAVDQLIKFWENFGQDVGDHWYMLRDKLGEKK